MTDLLCSSLHHDLFNNTHVCDKDEDHTTEHGCHCGVTWPNESEGVSVNTMAALGNLIGER